MRPCRGLASIELVQKAINDVQDQGYCVLRSHFASRPVEACRDAFWPRLLACLAGGPASNRGPHRHFRPMPFEPPCFTPQFFVDPDVLGIVRGLMDDRVVADQWGCDVSLRGSEYQGVHVDYARPLFPEVPNLPLPVYAVVVSFGLVRIAREHGPLRPPLVCRRQPRSGWRSTRDVGSINCRTTKPDALSDWRQTLSLKPRAAPAPGQAGTRTNEKRGAGGRPSNRGSRRACCGRRDRPRECSWT
jgi:hypothetical protein